ncbi:MAG: hypothetical protein K9J12_15870 [Melioribacteraceae bacterium]|nr:hypothetical protein [Melioribacteraceae bacterium]MCF8263679.1 hypothetical protein [Melioribacteraceae bacterium]MCF8431075.1 hypothetical protein [Melioribacteraceae bacterium]
MMKYIFLLFLGFMTLQAQDENESCFDCHSDQELTKEHNGKEISLFVEAGKFSESVHADMLCVDCHEDVDPEDLPHDEELEKVDCSNCHDTEEFNEGIHSAKNIECYDCHSKHEIQFTSNLIENQVDFCTTCHQKPSVKNYTKSVHFATSKDGEGPKCLDCHGSSAHGIKDAKLTEPELHEMCASCHKDAVVDFENSLHGKALSRNQFLAPNCITCHNSHEIRSAKDVKSKTYVMNIPNLCGDCHKDGTTVSAQKGIGQRHILANYSQSIHGDGLFRRGLTVTAVCTSCHFSHKILPHENPNSSINRDNIANTCMQCHSQIETVHQKVINGELWEKEPHKIPACIECHQPHEVRRVFYEERLDDEMCMDCHSRKDISKTVDGKKVSLFVDADEVHGSAHKENSCIKCHTNVSTENNPVCLSSGKVDCSICHAEAVEDYTASTHGQLHAANDSDAPYCTDCHGDHGIKVKADVKSVTFKQNIPMLCGECHKEGGVAAKRYKGEDHNIFSNYQMSIHGKGLSKSGLLVTATCTNCHTTHRELPVADITSSINPVNIAETCATCHLGVYEDFKESVHSPLVTKTDKKLPACNDCHLSHTIERVGEEDFRLQILNQCGKCHEEVTKTYFDTFHGKVSKLGSDKTARCNDCHGSHNILPPINPNSTLSRDNIVETCKTCHPNSNRKFVGYLTHATHHDKDKYPFLFYTFWFMSILLVSTFAFFGLHTLLWLPRGLAEKRKQRKAKKNQPPKE